MAENNHLRELINKYRTQNIPEKEIEALEKLGDTLKVCALGGNNIKVNGIIVSDGVICLLQTNYTSDGVIPHVIYFHTTGDYPSIFLGDAYLRIHMIDAIWRNVPYQSMPVVTSACHISKDYFESQIQPKKNHAQEVVIKRAVFTPKEFIQSAFGSKYGSERSLVEEKLLEAIFKGASKGKFKCDFKEIADKLQDAITFDMTAQLSDKYNPFTEANIQDYKDFTESVNNNLITIESVEVKSGNDTNVTTYSKMAHMVGEVVEASVQDVKEAEFMQNANFAQQTDVATLDDFNSDDSAIDSPVNIE